MRSCALPTPAAGSGGASFLVSSHTLPSAIFWEDFNLLELANPAQCCVLALACHRLPKVRHPVMGGSMIGLAVFDLIRRNVHATASSYFSMPVRSVARALCQNGLARFIAAGGRSPRWIKVKNPNAPAVTREAGGGVGH